MGSTSEEPTVVELKDGRLLMYIRNGLGYVGRSYSADGGVTWSKPDLTSFKHPRGPLTLTRIPQTGDLLFFWLNNPDAPDRRSKRCDVRRPLVCAVSKDEGRTWTPPILVADGPEEEGSGDFGYVTTKPIDDCILLSFHTYYAVHVARVPIAWFYRKD
jgi:sialidase-1